MMLKIFLRTFLLTLLATLLATGAFYAGYLFRQQQEASQVFPVLDEAFSVLVAHGIKDPPPAPAMQYGMIRGMLQAYDDPYTVFLEPPQNELEGNRLEGSYGGIGAQVEKDAQGYWVLYPFAEGPARQAGLQDGDRVLEVDGQAITAETPQDTLLAALRGPVGSEVRLSIGRAPAFQPMPFRIRRAEIPLPSVTSRIYAAEPRLGVIKVNLIAASTAEEIQKAVAELQQRGATHFALDLRDNPGGLLDAGVDIARLFLKDGAVMQQQYRGQAVKTFEVEEPGPLADLPVVVLINHGSASAAEIAAGALQARQRAELIGETSFGKNTIQLVFTLQDGSSLHVTSAQWWLPGMELPRDGQGLQPDLPIDAANAAPAGTDAYLQAAVRSLFETP
jgi:carboxyl-terminal processing protease